MLLGEAKAYDGGAPKNSVGRVTFRKQLNGVVNDFSSALSALARAFAQWSPLPPPGREGLGSQCAAPEALKQHPRPQRGDGASETMDRRRARLLGKGRNMAALAR